MTVEPGKLFIGAMSWDSTTETLEAHFGRFGKLSECIAVTDPNTGKCKGFGFLTFEDPDVVATVMKSGRKLLFFNRCDAIK